MPRLAGLEVEFCRAESDKYALPLLLLHGLWTSPAIWRASAAFLSHRGWNSYTLSWRDGDTSSAAARERVQRAAAELGRPVVVGHDFGGNLALGLRDVSAAVAICPLPCGPGAPAHPLSRSLRARLARWRGAEFWPAAGEAQRLLGLSASQVHVDSARWWEELGAFAPERPPPAAGGGRGRGRAAPRLVVAGTDDPVTPLAAAAEIATQAQAELVTLAGAHDLLYGPRWQGTVTEVHRWLVRQLGGEILLLDGDEDLRDE